METAQERASLGRPVGRDYIPLSQSPQLSRLTFGRKSRRSSADPAFCGTKNATAALAAQDGSGVGGRGTICGEKDHRPSPLSSSVAHEDARRGRNYSTRSTELAVVGCGGPSARKVVSSRKSVASSSLTSPGTRTPASFLPSTSKKEGDQQQSLTRFLPSDRRAAERGDYDEAVPSNSAASASPELLYASGRIAAARYHKMLADINKQGGSRGTTVVPHVGIIPHREAGAAGVGETVAAQAQVVGGGRQKNRGKEQK